VDGAKSKNASSTTELGGGGGGGGGGVKDQMDSGQTDASRSLDGP